jgi:hypothetical protein
LLPWLLTTTAHFTTLKGGSALLGESLPEVRIVGDFKKLVVFYLDAKYVFGKVAFGVVSAITRYLRLRYETLARARNGALEADKLFSGQDKQPQGSSP